MGAKLLLVAQARLVTADHLCSQHGATLAVVRAYRDAYKAAALLAKAYPAAARLADVAAERANVARGLL